MDLTQVLTLGAVLVSLAFAIPQYVTARGQSEDLAQQRITEGIEKAVEQLGTRDNLQVRLGGIYVLGKIALDSPPDQPAIMNVLATFIGEAARVSRTPTDTCPDQHVAPDVQAALDVLSRRNAGLDYLNWPIDWSRGCLREAEMPSVIPPGIDLTGADLTSAHLPGAHLTRADLRSAHLTAADLTGADLTGAELSYADLCRARMLETRLTRADLSAAMLDDADLTAADLREARVPGASLRGAILHGTRLEGATLSESDLRGASMDEAALDGAYLSRASLRGATFDGAQLSGASLLGADLADADLRTAVGVSGAQLADARTDGSTRLPDDL